MDIVVTGSRGFIGTCLVNSLRTAGHTVRRIVRPGRGSAQPGDVHWDPENERVDLGALEGHDAAIHLAGESIAAGRWTAERKRRIRDSRIHGTQFFRDALGRLALPPRVLISASAIGYYGNRGDEILTEKSPPGTGFLAGLCCEWEQAAHKAGDARIRVVHLRTGLVLHPSGGALARMLFPFKLGLGGKIASGLQYMSWITLEDLIRIILFVVLREEFTGPVNAVSPNPVSNAEFTRILARVLSRPAFFPLPAGIARLVFGEMAEDLLLSSARVMPERLLESSFRFEDEDLESALRKLLAKGVRPAGKETS